MFKKNLILDKNIIQGLNSQDLNKFLNHRVLIPHGLQIECLGNLTKSCPKYEKKLTRMKQGTGMSEKEYTASLFNKIQNFLLAEYNNMDLIKMELFENIQIKMKHNFFDYKSSVSTATNYIDIFDHPGSIEQVARWAKGEFNANFTPKGVIFPCQLTGDYAPLV